MARLRDLDAVFLRVVDDHTWEHVDSLGEAQGVRFTCPKCRNHAVVCWFEGVSSDVSPGPGRWRPAGTGLDDLSFIPGEATSSVLILGGCNWHGNVTNGDAT